MNTRVLYAVVASAALTGAVALAQSSDQSAREIETEDTPITVVGCLQKESDYRRMNKSGDGGVLNTGAGTGNEFVLVDSAGDCATLAPGAAAYELTGKGEPQLEQFLGRRVEISGILKGGDITVDGRAEGGFDPLGRDLELRELSVSTFREAGVVIAQGAADADIAPVPVGTSGEQEAVDALPRTASPLALAGLLGLLSAGGGIAARAVRRRLSALR
jgi:hypothetical protein